MLKFAKYQGTGNDFIIFEIDEVKELDYSKLAKSVCDRHFGIGADGMIIVAPSNSASIQMIFYNADGTRATMCGNGIRCFAKYVYDHRLVESNIFTVETLAGILTVEVLYHKQFESLVKINMGKPQYLHETVPTPVVGDAFINQVLTLEEENYIVSSLFMGTIHTILFVDNIDEKEAIRLGEIIEHHFIYPQKTNVNFCKVVDSKNIEVLTWEKGVGLTLACGTGSAACAHLSQKLYHCEDELTVHTRGGNLLMREQDDGLYMTGPATLICEGSFAYQ